MNHEFWHERISDYLDGGLDHREQDALRGHLEECAACREVESDLAEIRRQGRALGELEPTRDLWEGIRARLGEDPLAGEVIDLTKHLPGGPSAPAASAAAPLRRTHLIAAGLVLLLGGWALGTATTRTDGVLVPTPSVPLSTTFLQASQAVGDVELVTRLETLEAAVRSRSEELSPEARAVLERNLAIIDRALEESLQALASEPGSAYLQEHLGTSLRRREAALQATLRRLERSS